MTVRIAMWSGPRNISTAMMRAFENRPDTSVIDEPFYGVYLDRSGADHPLRAETLAAWPTDPGQVIRTLLGPAAGGRDIFYQKHMTHHMLPGIDLGWMAACRNVFLIRRPEAVLASYVARRSEVTLDDIGFVQQATLFDREADRLGYAPPVIDAQDILADPAAVLTRLCLALNIPFSAAMLRWPPGPRATDGPWAGAWYDAVERTTGFGPRHRSARGQDLDAKLRPLVEAALPHYERLGRHRL